MNSETRCTLSEAQLYFAKQANGEAWGLLEQDVLSDEQQDLLLYTAFASSYHWNSVGDLVNKQRGEWLISRAYSKLAMGESALFHAKKCFNLTQDKSTNFQDFDYAYASEAMARSYAVKGESDNAMPYYKSAIDYGDKISNEKNRQQFLDDFKSGNWNGFEYTQ